MQWWCAAQAVAWTWEWQAYPGIWLFVALLVVAYVHLRRRYGDGPERPDRIGDVPRSRLEILSFSTGTLALWVALDWPVGALGAGYLASVHMVQFLLIALVAPPFLLLGLPAGLHAALEGRSWPGAVAAATHPLTTLAVFTAIVGVTHWPPVVDRLMPTQLGNMGLDLAWLAAGILFWWPVVSPAPSRPWLGHPVKIGYLILATILNTGTFAYLTFSELPLYATYELAPPFPGLTTREDQTVAGLLMKMGGALVLWSAITVLFARWYVTSERRA